MTIQKTKTTTESKLSRRKFLRAGAATAASAAGAAALGFPMISKGARKIVLKMQGSWGQADVFNEMAEDYVKRVNDMAGGELKIDYLLSGAVVKAFQVQDAVNKGVLDGAHTVVAYWYGKNKAASLFGSGPMTGADSEQTLAWMYHGGGLDLYHELVQKVLGLNLVGFFAMPMPTQPLGWFKHEITDVSQLKGLKYRTVGLATDLMTELGMKVTQLPGGEIIPAMERGVIEAFEYNNPTSDSRFGAQDVSKVYMMGSYHQAQEYFEIIFNKTKYNSLPKHHQAILRYSAEAASSDNLWKAFNYYSNDLQKLINKDGVKVYRTPASVFDAQLKAWDVLTQRLGQDPFFKKVVDSQMAWAKKVGYYWFFNQADYKRSYEHNFGKLPF